MPTNIWNVSRPSPRGARALPTRDPFARARFLESIAQIDAASWNALAGAASPSCATNSCWRWSSPAAPCRAPAGPAASDDRGRQGRSRRRHALVSASPFARRVRVRFLLGQCLHAARPATTTPSCCPPCPSRRCAAASAARAPRARRQAMADALIQAAVDYTREEGNLVLARAVSPGGHGGLPSVPG
jgi:hypothetical protein